MSDPIINLLLLAVGGTVGVVFYGAWVLTRITHRWPDE